MIDFSRPVKFRRNGRWRRGDEGDKGDKGDRGDEGDDGDGGMEEGVDDDILRKIRER